MFFEICSIIGAICSIVSCIVECASIVFNAMKELGIIDTEASSSADLGARILTAEENGVYREDFKDFEDWKNYVNSIEVDENKKFDPEDVAKKAFEYEAESIIRYLNRDLSPDACAHIFENMEYFKDNNRLEYFKNNDIDIDDTIIDIGNYLENKIIGYEADVIKNKLVDIEQAIDPNISKTEALDNIYSYKK